MSIYTDTTNLQKLFEDNSIFKPAGDVELEARRQNMQLKRYTFIVRVSGIGYDENEAWQDANESYIQDPGGYDEVESEVVVDPDTGEDLV